jgi:hypothetical protein
MLLLSVLMAICGLISQWLHFFVMMSFIAKKKRIREMDAGGSNDN